jgi:hypothetical protein
MAANRTGSSSASWAGWALGGVVAGLALPLVLKASRSAARSLGATTFTSGSAGSRRAGADPARGRPA